MTGGRALEHMEEENDRVRMVEEDVFVRIFDERIETARNTLKAARALRDLAETIIQSH